MLTSRKILGLPVPAAIAGGVVLAGGGVALAAILLTTTTIGGTATVDTVATNNKVEIKVEAVNGTQLKCVTCPIRARRHFTSTRPQD